MAGRISGTSNNNQHIMIIIRKETTNDKTPMEINKEFPHYWPLSSALRNIYFDRVIKGWLQITKQNILAKGLILYIIVFTDYQRITANR
jgi:hypothetical protein